MASALFTPVQLGNVQLQHRIAMAPLTRFRADEQHVHQDVAREYYEQRATVPGTLIITEATFISPEASGYPNVPGVYSEDQINAWKRIVEAVHAKGSFIYLQLWALGRAASADNLKKEYNLDVVSSSDVAFEGGDKPISLSTEEIRQYIAAYAKAAKNFVELAGGDGVEVHGANGYLIDQFTQTNSNKRTDHYGGSVENRVRFGLEVVEAVTAAVGPQKVGIRLSPFSKFQGMKMPLPDIRETFSYFVKSLKSAHPELSYIHVVESRIAGNTTIEPDQAETLDFLYDVWTPKTFLVAGGFSAKEAEKEASERENTVIVFGRYFISNPDLVKKIKYDVPFEDYNRDTFYLYGPSQTEGYTTYKPSPELIGKA